MIRQLTIYMAAVLSLAGCAPGPGLKTPAIATPSAWLSSAYPERNSLPVAAGAHGPTYAPGRDIPAEWWSLFKSPELDQLVRLTLENNLSLAAAQASLSAAQEQYHASSGELLNPDFNAALGASRMKTSSASFGNAQGKGSIFNLYNASINVRYNLDFFGGQHKSLEALAAKVEAGTYQLEGVRLTLAANTATTALRAAEIREELYILAQINILTQQQLDLVQSRFKTGSVAHTDVLAAQSTLNNVRSRIPQLENERSRLRHQLAILCGLPPSDENSLPDLALDSLEIPDEIPLSLPSELARQRPDIQASEAMVRSAAALVGVATAKLYPNISLNGSWGPNANDVSDLWNVDRLVWNAGAALVQPLFKNGQLKASQRSAIAIFNESAAQYRQTVLSAFADVANALRSIENDSRRLSMHYDNNVIAREQMDAAEKRLKAGAVSEAILLAAQIQEQESRLGVVRSSNDCLVNIVTLFQALGGGWSNDRMIDKQTKGKSL